MLGPGESPWFWGTDLAVGGDCISRSRSRFWMSYTDPFQGNDVVLGPVPLKMALSPGGAVPAAVIAPRLMAAVITHAISLHIAVMI